MNIIIIPKRIRMIRESQNITRATLAEHSKMSERQIARIEGAKADTIKVREHTVIKIARALGTSPAVLKGEIPLLLENMNREKPRDGGKTKMKLDPGLQIDYDLVQHHYGVSENELVALAPTLFTLMAEACIVWHRKRQKKFESQIKNLQKTVPYDSGTGFQAGGEPAIWKMFQAAEKINLAEVSEKNLKGGEEKHTDSYLSNSTPFHVYLYDFINKIVRDGIKTGTEIKPAYTSYQEGIGILEWQGIIDCEMLDGHAWPSREVSNTEIQIFSGLYYEIIGTRPSHGHTFDDEEGFLGTVEQRDAFLAEKALQKGYARITEIPEDLFAPDKTKERVEWLIGKLPEDYDDKWLAERKTWQGKTVEVAEK